MGGLRGLTVVVSQFVRRYSCTTLLNSKECALSEKKKKKFVDSVILLSHEQRIR